MRNRSFATEWVDWNFNFVITYIHSKQRPFVIVKLETGKRFLLIGNTFASNINLVKKLRSAPERFHHIPRRDRYQSFVNRSASRLVTQRSLRQTEDKKILCERTFTHALLNQMSSQTFKYCLRKITITIQSLSGDHHALLSKMGEQTFTIRIFRPCA